MNHPKPTGFAMSKYRLKFHQRWDDGNAKYDEWYTLQYAWDSLIPFRKKPIWKTVGYTSEAGHIDIRGDKKWAEKQAKHYKIPMPPAPQLEHKEPKQ